MKFFKQIYASIYEFFNPCWKTIQYGHCSHTVYEDGNKECGKAWYE